MCTTSTPDRANKRNRPDDNTTLSQPNTKSRRLDDDHDDTVVPPSLSQQSAIISGSYSGSTQGRIISESVRQVDRSQTEFSAATIHAAIQAALQATNDAHNNAMRALLEAANGSRQELQAAYANFEQERQTYKATISKLRDSLHATSYNNQSYAILVQELTDACKKMIKLCVSTMILIFNIKYHKYYNTSYICCYSKIQRFAFLVHSYIYIQKYNDWHSSYIHIYIQKYNDLHSSYIHIYIQKYND